MRFESMTLGRMLSRRSEEYGEKPYLLFNDEVYSYRRLNEAVNQVAEGFMRLGVKKDVPVNIHLSNRPEFVLSFFALAKIGAIANPTNLALTGGELQYIVNHADAVVTVTEQSFLETIRSIRSDCPLLEQIVLVGGDGPGEDYIEWNEFIRDGSPDFDPGGDVDPDDVVVNMYTSGTTSLPKGVMLTHRNIISNGHSWMWLVGFTPKDRTMTGLPLFHANALFFSLVGSMVFGGSFLLLEKLSASRYLALAKQYQVTHFNFVGSAMGIMVSKPESPADTDHQVRVVHNAMGTPELIESWVKRFQIEAVMVYNLTECALATGTPISGPNPIKYGCIGWPAPSMPFPTEVKVVDENGREAPVGVVGEILLKGPGLMKGYYKNPEKTAETVQDGWLRTGDAGYRDEDGCFWFSDRIKDVLKPKGENVSSAEVEGVIGSHSKVADVAVIGVPDPVTIEEIKASILLVEGETSKTVPPLEIVDLCRSRLASFKVPRFYEYREKPVPRILGGAKIRKKDVRAEKKDNPTQGCFDLKTGQWLP